MRDYVKSIHKTITTEKTKLEKQLENPKSKLLTEALTGAIAHLERISVSVEAVPETLTRKKPGPKPKSEAEKAAAKAAKSANATATKPKNATKKTNKTTKTTKNAKNDIMASTKKENKLHPITESFTNKRPLAVVMDGEEYMATSFRQVSEVVCRNLYAASPKRFMSLAANSYVNGDSHKYFSNDVKDISAEPVLFGKGGRAIYVDIAKLAVNNMFFLKRVIKTMDKDPADVMIKVDPTFQRKPRDMQSKKAN